MSESERECERERVIENACEREIESEKEKNGSAENSK